MTELSVRIGKPEDVYDIMELALSACEENGFLEPEPVKLLGEIWSALNLNHGLVGVISQNGNKPEAAVLLRIGEMWYSNAPVIEEKAIFVKPEFRAAKEKRAQTLCDFSKSVSKQLNIPLIIGILSNHRTKSKVKLYERQFGPPAGAFFLFGASTGLEKPVPQEGIT